MTIIRPWEHRRAAAFADALDGREPDDAEIGRMVHVAEALCRAAAQQPEEEFTQKLRTQLMQEAATALAPDKSAPASRTTHRAYRAHPHVGSRRNLSVLVATAVLSGGSFGLVSESASALPGDMLYPVKRTVESSRLMLSLDPSSAGAARLDLAQKRLEEVKEIASDEVDPRVGELVGKTLRAFSEQAVAGAALLLGSSSGNRADIDKVMSFTQSSSKALRTLSGRLSASAEDAYKSANETVDSLSQQALALCPACSSGGPLLDPPSVLGARDLLAPSADTTVKKPTKEHDEVSEAERSPITPTPAAPQSEPTPHVLDDVTEPIRELATTILGGLLGGDGALDVEPDRRGER